MVITVSVLGGWLIEVMCVNVCGLRVNVMWVMLGRMMLLRKCDWLCRICLFLCCWIFSFMFMEGEIIGCGVLIYGVLCY